MRKNHWTANFKKKSKAERTSIDGSNNASSGEMKRWHRLQLLEREGYITDLEREVPFPLTLPNGNSVRTVRRISKKTGKPIGGRIVVYKLDFRYRVLKAINGHEPGAIIHEEFKGFMAEDAALKISMVEAIYGITIYIVKKP